MKNTTRINQLLLVYRFVITLFVLGLVLLTSGCNGTKTDESLDALNFNSALKFKAIEMNADELCGTGQTKIQFTTPYELHGYSILLAKGDALSAYTTGVDGLDAVIALYGPADADGFYGQTPVAVSNDGGNGLESHLTWTAKDYGAYFVVVTIREGKGSTLFHLSINNMPGCFIAANGCKPLTLPQVCGNNHLSCSQAVQVYFDVTFASKLTPKAACTKYCNTGENRFDAIVDDKDHPELCPFSVSINCDACCTLSDKRLELPDVLLKTCQWF